MRYKPEEFAHHQQKVFKIDDHMCIAMSGMTSDASTLPLLPPYKPQGVLCKYMRNECMNHKYTYELDHPIERLVFKIAEKSQIKTQRAGKRPYGVGLLVIG